MRTLRLIGFAIIAIVMSVNFAACNDDDEDIDVNQLEGNWGLVLDEGYEYYEGEKIVGVIVMTLQTQQKIVKNNNLKSVR